MLQVFYSRPPEVRARLIRMFNQHSYNQSHAWERVKDGVWGALSGGSNPLAMVRTGQNVFGAHDFDYYLRKMTAGDQFQMRAILRNPSGRMESHDLLAWSYSSGRGAVSLVNRAMTSGDVVLDQYRGKSAAQIRTMEAEYGRVYKDDAMGRARSALAPSELAELQSLRHGGENNPLYQRALQIYQNGRGAWLSDPSAMFAALEPHAGNVGELDRAYRNIGGQGLAHDLASASSGPLSRLMRSYRGSDGDWQGRIAALTGGRPDEYLARTGRLFAAGQVDWNETRRAFRTLGKQGTSFAEAQAAYARIGGQGSLRDLLASKANGDRRVAADLNMWSPVAATPTPQGGASGTTGKQAAAASAQREVGALAADLAHRIGDRRNNNDDAIEAFLRDVPAAQRGTLQQTFRAQTGKSIEDALRARSIAGWEEVQAQSSAMAGGMGMGFGAPRITTPGPYDEARIRAMMQTLNGTRGAADELADVGRGLDVSQQFARAMGRAQLPDLTGLRARYDAAARSVGSATTFDQAIAKLPSEVRNNTQLQLQVGEMLRTGNFANASQALQTIIGNERALDGSLWTSVQARFADATGFRGVPLDDSMRQFMSDAQALRAKADRGEQFTDADRARMRTGSQRVMHNYTQYLREKGANAETAAMVAATVATLGYGAIASGATMAGRAALFGLVSAGTQKGLDANTTPEQMAKTFITGAAFEVGGELAFNGIRAGVRSLRARSAASSTVREGAQGGASGGRGAATSGTARTQPRAEPTAEQPRTQTTAREEPRTRTPAREEPRTQTPAREEPRTQTSAREEPRTEGTARDEQPRTETARPVELPRAARADGVAETRYTDLQLDSRLNHGGNSNVYPIANDPTRVVVINKAVDPRVTREVADNVRATMDASIREDIGYMASLRDVTFEGRAVAPRVDSFVTDAEGRVLGYVTERIPGTELETVLRSGQLSAGEIDTLLGQVDNQMRALHAAGRVHGDPHAGNVLVTREPLQARLLDFTPPASSWGVTEDASRWASNLRSYREAAKPENVRSFLQAELRSAENAAAEAEQRAFHAFAGELRTPVSRAAGAVDSLADAAEASGNGELARILREIDEETLRPFVDNRRWTADAVNEFSQRLEPRALINGINDLVPAGASPELRAARDTAVSRLQALDTQLNSEAARAAGIRPPSYLSTLERTDPAFRGIAKDVEEGMRPLRRAIGNLERVAEQRGDDELAHVLSTLREDIAPLERSALKPDDLEKVRQELANTGYGRYIRTLIHENDEAVGARRALEDALTTIERTLNRERPVVAAAARAAVSTPVIRAATPEAIGRVQSALQRAADAGPNQWIPTGNRAAADGELIQRGLSGNYATQTNGGVPEARALFSGTETTNRTVSYLNNASETARVTEQTTRQYASPIAIQARVERGALTAGRSDAERITTRPLIPDDITGLNFTSPTSATELSAWLRRYQEVLRNAGITPTPGSRGADFIREANDVMRRTARFDERGALANDEELGAALHRVFVRYGGAQ